MNVYQLLFGIMMLLPALVVRWIDHAAMPQPRAGYAAGVLASRLVVAGGSFWIGDTKKRTNAVDAFDPRCNCWRSLAPLPVALSDTESVTVGKTLFVLGGTAGREGLRDVYAFDGSGWTKRDDLRMPQARLYGTAVTDGHRIYIMGGISVPGNYASGLRSVWSIDPSHPEHGWNRLPDCPCEPRASAGAAALPGTLLLIGGLRATAKADQNLADIWSLDLETRQWKRIGTLPEGRRAMWAAAVGDKVFLFGGYTNHFCSDILIVEDGAVSPGGKLPEAVADAGFFRIGSQWYTAGGEIGQHVRGTHTWSGEVLLRSGKGE